MLAVIRMQMMFRHAQLHQPYMTLPTIDTPPKTTDSSENRSEHSFISNGTTAKETDLVLPATDSLLCVPSVSGIQNTFLRKRKATLLNYKPKDNSESSSFDDTDEDPTFVCEYDDSSSKKKKKNRFPLFVFSEAESDSDNEVLPQQPPVHSAIKDHIYCSPKKVQGKIKHKEKTVKEIKRKEKLYKWCKIAKTPTKFETFKYSQKFGPNVDIPDNPLSILKLILDDDICTTIVEESNRYALQHKTTLDLNVEELHAFIGILIFMGFHVLPSMRHYWSEDENFHVERIARVMSVKRFLKILRFIHVNDNTKMPKRGELGYDKLFKVRPFLNHLNTKYMVLFSPSRHLAVDESMVGFKGRSSLKQYMPKKPIKRGFKIWVCACSQTGFVLSFDVYTGKQAEGGPVLGLGEKVVLKTTAPFLGLGHCIYFDNFFSSVSLVHKLLEENTFSCATILPTRVEYPQDEMKNDKDISTHCYDFAQVNDVSVVKWADRGKKTVSVISSIHNPSVETTVERTNSKGVRETVSCPVAVAQYNKFMGGVDRFDQHMANYTIVQKSKKWWMKLFYYFLDSAVVNSFILYTQSCNLKNQKPMSHLKFRSALVNGLIGSFSSKKRKGYMPASGKARKRNSPSGRPTIENTIRLSNVGAHMPEKNDKYRRCAMCSTKKKEKRSNIICKTCNVALCKECFLPFHKS